MPWSNSLGEFRQRYLPKPLPRGDPEIQVVFPDVVFDVPSTRLFYCAVFVFSVVAVPTLLTYIVLEHAFLFEPVHIAALGVSWLLSVITWLRNVFTYNRAAWPPSPVLVQSLVVRMAVWGPFTWLTYAQISRGNPLCFATSIYVYIFWAITENAVLNNSWLLTKQQLFGFPLGITTDLMYALVPFCFNYAASR